VSTGALTFARFAYPPNALGLCGPDAPRELLERADAAAADGGLRELALQFEGAWPYLELIAHAHGIADPLDLHVVEAYWIGNDLLDGIPPGAIGEDLVARFGPAAGRERRRIEELASAAPRPHHDFHVLCVYPWVGLLRSAAAGSALHVLDRCRIRWGRVTGVDGATASVRSRELVWDGDRLALGALREEVVRIAEDGYALDRRIQVGDTVALHWDWACARLTDRQERALRSETARQLAFANRLAVPPPAAILR
jgi:hypothetical protein